MNVSSGISLNLQWLSNVQHGKFQGGSDILVKIDIPLEIFCFGNIRNL
jgi:hypothetical protein